MKKCLKIISLVLLFNVIFSTYYSTLAKGGGVEREDLRDLDTSITSDGFISQMNPNNSDKSTDKIVNPVVKLVKTVINNLLQIIQIIGGFLIAVSFAIFGFGMLASGNSALAQDLGIMNKPASKENLLKFGRGLLIGSTLLFASSTIVLFVYKAIG